MDDETQFLQDLHEQIQKVKENMNTSNRTMREYSSGNESMVLHRGDDHFGATVEDERGEEIFNTEMSILILLWRRLTGEMLSSTALYC